MESSQEVPGIMPRVDSYQNTVINASVYEHNREPCYAAGKGKTPEELNLCMVTRIGTDD